MIEEPGEATDLGKLSIRTSGQSQVTRYAVWTLLESTPELKYWLGSHDCRRTELFRGSEWKNDKAAINIPTAIVTLNSLLEMSTTESGVHSWSILKNTREGACEIYISLW